MPCYKPMIGLWKGQYTDTGKKKYEFISREASKDIPPGYEYVKVPCGNCIGCRLDYSRYWADRMMLELAVQKKAIFVTLTYDRTHAHASSYRTVDIGNAYLPIDPQERIVDGEYLFPDFLTLNKKDCQNFMKNLRRTYVNVKIRFYLAGEYGDRTLRPHYHAIIYGLSLDDFPDKVKDGKNELGDQYYHSPSFDKIWKNGKCVLADVSWKTCAYVARYCTKKWNGAWSVDYAVRNCDKEFSLMSRRPGIGKPYLDLHPDALDYQTINISTPEGGRKITIPKYFLNTLELTDPERFDKMKQERMKFAEDAMILKLQKTGLGEVDYLLMQEQNKFDSVKRLKRNEV